MPKKENIYKVWETPPVLLAREIPAHRRDTDPQKASEQALLRFIYHNLRYPPVSRQHSIEGTVVISFHIGANGLVDRESIRCVRDIGGGFGEEGVRIIRLMADLGMRWQPATRGGKAIPVRYNVPIRIGQY